MTSQPHRCVCKRPHACEVAIQGAPQPARMETLETDCKVAVWFFKNHAICFKVIASVVSKIFFLFCYQGISDPQPSIATITSINHRIPRSSLDTLHARPQTYFTPSSSKDPFSLSGSRVFRSPCSTDISTHLLASLLTLVPGCSVARFPISFSGLCDVYLRTACDCSGPLV